MYVENKSGDIDGARARIGWVEFSKTGLSIYYRGRTFKRIQGGGISGNYYEEGTGNEYWISGVKKRGGDVHFAQPLEVIVDEDAREEYQRVKSKRPV